MAKDHPTPAEPGPREMIKLGDGRALDMGYARNLIGRSLVEYCEPGTDRQAYNLAHLAETLFAELARRDAALADLTRQRDEARANAERMRLACAIYGVGTDPNGYYAGTPGARVRELLHAEAQLERQAPVIEAARALVADWNANRSTHGGPLVAAVDALGPVDPEATAQPSGAESETGWYPVECEHGWDHCPTCDAKPPTDGTDKQ